MAATLDLRRTPAPSKSQRQLQELQTSRDSLMRQRTAALNRRAHLRNRLLKRQTQTQIRRLGNRSFFYRASAGLGRWGSF